MSLSQDRWDEGDVVKLKVDGALYPEAVVPSDGRPHWEVLSALLEFKAGGTKFDPYDDIKKGDADATTRVNVRGQLTEYVAHAFAHQHRSAMFLFLVNGFKMRATRWDRSGTIFTEAFDYTQNRELLRDLFWGFSRLTPRGQGLDYSVTPLRPDDEDYRTMTDLAEENENDISEEEGTIVRDPKLKTYVFKYVRSAFAASIAGDAARYRIAIPTPKGNRFYLAAKPHIVAAGMSGRGTRGYVAWDLAGKRFVWLKDAWRPIYDNVATEGSVLRTLNKVGVRNVPTYVCDGELEDETETPNWAKPPLEETSNKPEEAFRHYRIVVEEVCMPLTEFKNGKQLLSTVRDCVQAHGDAVNKAHIHHRDVSGGNVLIYPTVVRSEHDGKLRVVWKGLLTDWELSKPTTPANGEPAARQPVRTGTWQFTAARILDNPSSAVVTADELEAFFYVILYNALRYLRHTCPNVQLTMFDYFDAYDFVDGQYRCGGHKRSSMQNGTLPQTGGHLIYWIDDAGKLLGHPFNHVIVTMLRWFRARYAMLKPLADDDNPLADEESAMIAALSGRAPESDIIRELAQKLDSHKSMLDLLQ
ncbi:hypothetical protein OH76DRAFT_1497539 [Lentinus brumalis]|uniref:Fungal-type protein kinase domain-containing protein n=1 Tax=Lentinus brumalis TaxID=2498619 RepID=A0A371DK87_9APHY|nr:hypothetical protein OH76DRAFT_1497539 [Polyporus brumalis]